MPRGGGGTTIGSVSAQAIRTEGLRKTYGDVEAVAGVDLAIEYGECFALLGPNGAGKTTTTEILEGYRDRTGGTAEVLGVDPGTRRAPGGPSSASCCRPRATWAT